MVPNVDIRVGVMSGNKQLLIATYFKVLINRSLNEQNNNPTHHKVK
jgi:hypothetical protein